MKPILFNTEMVKAILEGRKTCTRRIIKPQPEGAHTILDRDDREHTFQILCGNAGAGGFFEDWEENIKAPYWPGDILYVRETWQFIPCIDCGAYLMGICSSKPVIYEDKDSISEGCFEFRADYPESERIVWRPSIHMPKEAARIFLRVKDVRAERLQGISEREARKEGAVPISFSTDPEGTPESERKWVEVGAAVHDFIRIWDATVRKEDLERFGWDANPWVWVIEFERCEKPEVETK